MRWRPPRAMEKCAPSDRHADVDGAKISRFESEGELARARLFADIERLGKIGAYGEHAAFIHLIDQRAKRRLHVIEVAVDVGVIEFYRGDDRGVGAVMQKLRSLVEKRGVVFVALDDEVAAVAEAIVRTEIFRDAADHHRGIAARRVEHVRDHRGRGGLAMRSRHHQHALVLKEEMPQRLGHREVRDRGFQQRLGFRIVARDDVADHDQIRRGLQVLRAEAGFDFDLRLLQQRCGWLVELAIGTGDAISARGEHPRERRHRGATYADQMHVLRGCGNARESIRTIRIRHRRWPP